MKKKLKVRLGLQRKALNYWNIFVQLFCHLLYHIGKQVKIHLLDLNRTGPYLSGHCSCRVLRADCRDCGEATESDSRTETNDDVVNLFNEMQRLDEQNDNVSCNRAGLGSERQHSGRFHELVAE